MNARVTFIAADGAVFGDSAEPLEALCEHGEPTRRGPKWLTHRASGVGTARRSSATLREEILYVAVPVTHPRVAFGVLALPLITVQQQLVGLLASTLTALGHSCSAARRPRRCSPGASDSASTPSPGLRSVIARAT